MTTEFLGAATPIYFVGDSHTLAYADLLFERDGRKYITRSKFCHGLTTREFMTDEGELAPAIVNALVSEQLLQKTNDGLRATHTVVDSDQLRIGFARERDRTAPILVFFAGDLDLRNDFISKGALLDFEVPASLGFIPDPNEPEFTGQTITYAVARTFAERLLAPLLVGLRQLVRLGYSSLYVHSIPPQGIDDDAFGRLHGFGARTTLRYKASHIFNDVLASFAKEEPGIRFIDMWAATTIHDRIDPAYALDGIHLNRRSTQLTVDYILNDQGL